MDIKRTVDSIFKIRNIKTKEDLDKWCGPVGRNKLYRVVEILAEENWNSIENSKNLLDTITKKY